MWTGGNRPVTRTRLGITGALVVLLAGCTPAPSSGGPPVRVTIPEGATLAAITDTLHSRGVITRPGWFRLLARLRRIDRSLQAGRYEFSAPSPTRTVLDALRLGRRLRIRFTVPEGATLTQIARLAENRLGITVDSILVAARDSSILATFGIPATSAEGYLWPETYTLDSTETPRDLVRLMLTGFAEDWDPAWDPVLDSLNLTRHEVVTLASIVEGEARVEEERPVIAAVYLNRLRLGMPLQADPTIQYAIERATGERKTRLYEKDYRFASPYNTYLTTGLPPGPVNSPGRASLAAVLAPADVPWLYFVARADGTHAFSRTYAEHIRSIRQIRRAGDTGR